MQIPPLFTVIKTKTRQLRRGSRGKGLKKSYHKLQKINRLKFKNCKNFLKNNFFILNLEKIYD
ncbi:hypothetical protein PTH_1932 [Pelotomaculum thermopropionicum SI]|uniref:Uncharacterized protein n=1 Tax=Pelotomaculum thermopropionicum (strain DSM 13744 / JCM 10971 / SI) TaxID=370438 RepID=A5D0V9_PELTS|nr:hypothetical protein PTH_1932 [Pelotomaculum thermopropionicum SI]